MGMIIASVVAICCLSSTSFAQTQEVTFSGPLKIGYETDGTQWVTEITVVNRTGEQKAISSNFFDQFGASFRVHRKRSDGFEIETQGTTSSLAANKNGTSTISFAGSLTDGHIDFATSQTFLSALNKFVSDVEVQLVIKKINSFGMTILKPTALAPNGGDTTNGAFSDIISQALIRNSSKTGFSIYNPGSTRLTVELKIYSLFSPGSNPYIVESMDISPGQQVEETLNSLFISIAPDDGGGNPLTDATLEITASSSLNITAFRIDDGFRYELPIFIGRSPTVDEITIIKAKQKAGGKLIVYVIDSQSHSQNRPSLAIAIKFVDGSAMDLGQMDYDEVGDLFYKLQKHFVPDSIAEVRIVSSNGGTASSTVK